MVANGLDDDEMRTADRRAQNEDRWTEWAVRRAAEADAGRGCPPPERIQRFPGGERGVATDRALIVTGQRGRQSPLGGRLGEGDPRPVARLDDDHARSEVGIGSRRGGVVRGPTELAEGPLELDGPDDLGDRRQAGLEVGTDGRWIGSGSGLAGVPFGTRCREL